MEIGVSPLALPTVPAPAAVVTPARSTEQATLARFGTIGFDLYRSIVIAESNRRAAFQVSL